MKLKTIIFIAVAIVTAFSALALAADPPDKIAIKRLENLYEPCLFDHKLHIDVAPKCETCHHKGGTDGPNAACHTCHKVPFDEQNLGVIGFKGALHQQCMGCHAEKKVKNDCEACHAKKK
jgi:hypothetical protein